MEWRREWRSTGEEGRAIEISFTSIDVDGSWTDASIELFGWTRSPSDWGSFPIGIQCDRTSFIDQEKEEKCRWRESSRNFRNSIENFVTRRSERSIEWWSRSLSFYQSTSSSCCVQYSRSVALRGSFVRSFPIFISIDVFLRLAETFCSEISTKLGKFSFGQSTFRCRRSKADDRSTDCFCMIAWEWKMDWGVSLLLLLLLVLPC